MRFDSMLQTAHHEPFCHRGNGGYRRAGEDKLWGMTANGILSLSLDPPLASSFD